MAVVREDIRVCPTCGTRAERGDVDDELGCIACLLRVGLDDEHASDDRGAATERSASIGVYEIERREDGTLCVLGRGAMGVTYLARDTTLDRPVALKMIQADLRGGNAGAREWFLREARAAAGLRHPNIATVYQFGIQEETGECFCAMEFIEGETLDERIRRRGPLDSRSALRIASQITGALSAAAQSGIVHRDLKPGNVMVLGTGDDPSAITVKVIDFGVAKAITHEGDAMSLNHGGFVGTPAFASPEQFANSAIDVRSDIYSLGVTLWFALTGQMPFRGKSFEELRQAQLRSPLPVQQLKVANVPASFAALITSMLALDPAARPGVESLSRKLGILGARFTPAARRRRSLAFAAVGLAASMATAAVIVAMRDASLPSLEDKSVAVLPFENLSDGESDAFFATGMHDDVLVSLSKIHNLKVIAHNSVAQVSSGARDPRVIGKALHTRAVLEGSVRRFGNRSRIHMRLIDTREGRQIWAQNYDRELADIFAVQRDISESVANELRAALTPDEKAAMAQPPTQDTAAYDMYLQARMLLRPFGATVKAIEEKLPKATKLLEAAIQRDPQFALAYCLLSEAERTTPWAENPTPEQLEKSQATLQRALEIAPQSGEVHLALAQRDYESLEDTTPSTAEERRAALQRASSELAIAAAKLPGSVEVVLLDANIARHRGEFRRCLAQLRRAAELDPRDPEVAQRLAEVLIELREYDAADTVLDRAIAGLPTEATGSLWRRKIFVSLARGDTRSATANLEADPFHERGLAGLNFIVARILMYERRYDEAVQLIDSLGEIARAQHALPKSGINHYAQGEYTITRAMIHRATGAVEDARADFEASRNEFDGWLAQRPAEPKALGYHAIATAALGSNDEALREIASAVELWPPERDAINSAIVMTQRAVVYSWTGDHEAAIHDLQQIAKLPGGPSAGELRLHPQWDELRSDPRFPAIVAEAAQPPTFH